MIFQEKTQSMTPRSAVDSIAHLLSKTGELKGDDEAISLLDSMKEATMLFQKAIYLEVLKNTASEKTLTTYLSKGGWDLLNQWLADAKRALNNALGLEILEVLRHVPVTLPLLKQGNMGKVVKSFNKSEDKDIKKIASDLMDNWMKLVSAGGGPKKKKGPDDGISKKEQLGPRKGSSKSVHMAESLGFLDAITSTSKSTVPRKVRKRSSTDVDMRRMSLPDTPEASPLPKPNRVDKLSGDIEKPVSPKEPILKPEMLLTNSPPPLPEKSHGNDNMFCFRRAKKRRRIKWREDLEDVQFFECEEKSSSNHKSFSECMTKEYDKERQLNARSRQMGEDMMVEMVPWKHPLKQDASMQTLAEQGASSKERDFQKEREKNVLAVLVFDQNMMDETPKEPDLEELSFTYVAPRVIPLEDSTNPTQPHAAPEQKPSEPEEAPKPPQLQYEEAPGQLPPVLANMIPAQQQKQQLPSHSPLRSPHPNPPPLPMPTPGMMPHPEPGMLPHPDQFPPMQVQRYPPPPFHGNNPPLPHQTTYNTYNPDTRNFQGQDDRNGRDQSKRGVPGEGGWNYRKGGHGEKPYRDWVEMDRRNYGSEPRSDRPPRDRPWRPCAYYNTKHGCREGDNCKFVHEKGLHGSIPGQQRWDERDGGDRNVQVKKAGDVVKDTKLNRAKVERKSESPSSTS